MARNGCRATTVVDFVINISPKSNCGIAAGVTPISVGSFEPFCSTMKLMLCPSVLLLITERKSLIF